MEIAAAAFCLHAMTKVCIVASGFCPSCNDVYRAHVCHARSDKPLLRPVLHALAQGRQETVQHCMR